MENFDLNNVANVSGQQGNVCAQSRVVVGRDHRLSAGSRPGKRLHGAFLTPDATPCTTSVITPVTRERSMMRQPDPVMSCDAASASPDTPAAIWARLMISQALSL